MQTGQIFQVKNGEFLLWIISLGDDFWLTNWSGVVHDSLIEKFLDAMLQGAGCDSIQQSIHRIR